MALKKKTVLENGFEGDYWKIYAVNLNKQTMALSVSIGLFKDKDFADKPTSKPAKTVAIVFEIEKADAGSDLVKLAYEGIVSVISSEVKLGISDPKAVVVYNLKGAESV